MPSKVKQKNSNRDYFRQLVFYKILLEKIKNTKTNQLNLPLYLLNQIQKIAAQLFLFP